ncbi:hypothetical protein FK178_09860 [Antarcticibacterium arcticum]|uniref:Uncharacterized protein n=1 Tax=Antarcticibacterium arcticum TaxID=2585771 RepID=A0A5B8YS81_9FLAO|nr:hypothetical protein FK178_09860 [Antarcticibacterium arcticum]
MEWKRREDSGQFESCQLSVVGCRLWVVGCGLKKWKVESGEWKVGAKVLVVSYRLWVGVVGCGL